MPKVIKIAGYTYDELSDEAKEKAREWFREICLDYDWWDCIEDDFKEITSLMGIEVTDTEFDVYNTQGRGACFIGSFAYKAGMIEAVKSYAPKDKKLHRIASALYKVHKSGGYKLYGNISKRSHHYTHKYTVDISVDTEKDDTDVTSEQENAIVEIMRDLMDWYFEQLETEYEYRLSDETIAEDIRCNAYLFTSTGQRKYILAGADVEDESYGSDANPVLTCINCGNRLDPDQYCDDCAQGGKLT